MPRAVRRPDAAEAGAGAAGGRRQDPRHLARLDRPRRGSRALRGSCSWDLGIPQPASGTATSREEAREVAAQDRLPGRRAAVVRARRPRHGDRLRRGDARSLHDAAPSTRRRSIRCWSTSSSRTRSSSTSTRSPTRPARSSSAASWSTSRRPASTPATAPASCRRSSVRERHLATIRDYTRRIARALKVVGLMNVQYAIKDDVVYVLEVNPRASRTVPYLSKATGVPLAKVAAQGDGRPDARRARPDRRPRGRPACS